MRRLIIFLVLGMNICLNVIAGPACPKPFQVIQPNGDTIWVSLHGDEYASWYEDDRGNVIDRDNNRYWVYVNVEKEKKVLTNQIVTQTSMPVNVSRDSIFQFIAQKRKESYFIRNKHNLYLRNQQRQNEMIDSAKIPLPSEGQQKILTIMVDFPDVKFKNRPEMVQTIKSMVNDTNSYKHPNQSSITGSLNDYFLKASSNKFRVETNVAGICTASQPRSYYGADSSDVKDLKVGELAEEILSYCSKYPALYQYDNNNDGWIECVIILYAGEGQDLDTTLTDAIWPHESTIGKVLSHPSNNLKLCRYIMIPELGGNYYRGVGTLCHELGHVLGIPDFYDVNERVVADGDFLGTGNWDLMAKGYWNSYIDDMYSINPALPNPYVRTKLNWITPKELSGTNVLDTLRPSELDGNSIYKLSTSTQNEYYLLENRQDPNLPGTGLVVYHVNAGIENHIDSNTVNITHRQNMYVVDANNHIVKPTGSVTSYGNINSPNATFRSTHSQNMYFTSTSKPSNCAWNYDTTYNKDVCFISEEEIDGETCILFVLNPEIEGPDVLCDSAIYSLKHVPSEATIEWTYIRPSGLLATTVPLIIGSGQGTKAVCFKRGYKLVNEDAEGGVVTPEYPFVPAPTSARGYVEKPYSGFVEIQAKVTLTGETKTWRKTIYMPEKVEMNTLSNNWFAGAAKTITLKTPTDARVVNDITWNIELPGEFPYSVAGSSSITVTPRNGGTARFTATYIKGCHDEYMSHTKTYTVIKFPNLTYTNPASGSVEISVVNGDAQDESGMRTMSINNQPTPYMGAYRVELWHDIYGKVREMDVAENNPTIVMNLDGLNSGVYVLRLIIDNQIVEASQLIVR